MTQSKRKLQKCKKNKSGNGSNFVLTQNLLYEILKERGISKIVKINKNSVARKRWHDSLTKEERQKQNQKISLGMCKFFKTRTKKSQEERNRKHRETIKNMSPDKKDRWYRKIGLKTKKWHKECPDDMYQKMLKRKSKGHKRAYEKMPEEKKRSQVLKIQKDWNRRKRIIIDNLPRVNDYAGVITQKEFKNL